MPPKRVLTYIPGPYPPLEFVSNFGLPLPDDQDYEDQDILDPRPVDPFRQMYAFGYDREHLSLMRERSYGRIPSARMRYCQWITRITSQAMRFAYTIWLWNLRLESGDPDEFDIHGLLPPCTWCGMPTGMFCDDCADQGISPARSVCKACDQFFDCCRPHYQLHHRKNLDLNNGKRLILETLRDHHRRKSHLNYLLQSGEYEVERPNTWYHDRFLNGYIQAEDIEIVYSDGLEIPYRRTPYHPHEFNTQSTIAESLIIHIDRIESN